MSATFENSRATLDRQLQRTLQLFWSPSEAVADLGEKPGYVVPLVIATVGAVLIALISNRFVIAILASNVETSLDPQKAANALDVVGRLQIVGYALTPLLLMLQWFAVAGLLLLTAAFLNGSMSFRASFCLIASVEVFSLIKSGFTLLIIFLRGSDRLTALADLQPPIGANLLLPDAGEPLYTILGAINPFEIWYLVVLIIGVRALNRFSRTQAAAAVLMAWALIMSLRAAVAMFSRT